MDPSILTIQYSDPLWVAIAFFSGLLIKKIGLPPLIGFIGAGFALNALGAESGNFLQSLADLGITLLLFSIGLKLKLNSLAKPEVWGAASVHMILFTLLIAGAVFSLSFTNLPMLSGLDMNAALLIGFVMSFSSTVFVIKILDELGAGNSMHGRVAIGALVIQDIAAVLFIAISMGKLPTPFALGLLALIPLRHLIYKLFNNVGHGELLILFGITFALVGAKLFESVGIKADVGALIFGMMLANHPKANELAKALLGFKELFLVGFFLSVGMTAMPGPTEILIGLIFTIFLPLKAALFFGLFSRFKLRASSSWRCSMNLTNYSEFGLIVGLIAVSSGWLEKEWLSVFAVVMTLSFIISAPLANIREHLYLKWRPFLKKHEHPTRLPGEEDIDLAHVKILVFGMGRMGTAAYKAMERDYQEEVVGIEIEPEKAERERAQGMNVVCGDATNPDIWSRAPELLDGLEWVLLTMPTHKANLTAAERLKSIGYQGHIAATATYRDQEDDLKALGVDNTFNIYTEAGLGFANELQSYVENNKGSLT